MRLIKIGHFEIWVERKTIEFWWKWKELFEIPKLWGRR